MRSRWLNFIVAAEIALVLALAALAVNTSHVPKSQCEYTTVAKQEKPKESLWRPNTWEPTTAFTAILAFMAVGQAGLFFWQLGLIRRSVMGYFVYEDASGTRRRTAFCREFDQTASRFGRSGNEDYEHEE